MFAQYSIAIKLKRHYVGEFVNRPPFVELHDHVFHSVEYDSWIVGFFVSENRISFPSACWTICEQQGRFSRDEFINEGQ